MLNLPALSTASSAATALSNLILATPQDDVGIQAQAQGTQTTNPPKFLFNFYGEQTVDLESDITDHYTEGNTALQDQIALRPENIFGEGFIAELNDIAPDFLPLNILNAAQSRLSIVSAYVPGLSVSATLAYNRAVQAARVASLAAGAAVSAWNTVRQLGGAAPNAPINDGNATFLPPSAQNQQQVAFQMFYGYWKRRTLFSVQTPWAVFNNCAIKRVRATQDAETRMITSFSVDFKPLNFASTQTIGLEKFLQERAAAQNAASSPVFKNLGNGTPSTGASTMFGSVFGQ